MRKLKPDSPGPILCFVGPPGVGKTSLGKSIAKALGREFERISVGGVRDEAEIRGHRRTYIGAMPGDDRPRAARRRLAQPRVHDRRDRQDGRRLPRRPRVSAMLEVLDPAQNDSFRDHYLDLEFDLSDVMFIATANLLDPIPGPLQDRMEVDPARRLHGRREAPHREALPRPAPDRRERPAPVPDRVRRPGAEGDHRGVHARGRGAQPRARDRHVCRKVARDVAEGKADGKVQGLRQARPRAARPPPRLLRAAPPHQGPRRRDRASPGPRSAARSCSSRRRRCPARAT